jgi:holo-[acyl-carrier protein] synthase
MIVGIGIDSIEIERFADWHNYPTKSLLKIFSVYELSYCLQNPNKSAERFAARFAAKEAFLKALYPIIKPNKSLTLPALCKQISVTNSPTGVPYFEIKWQNLTEYLTENMNPLSHLSLTHNKTVATAFVILEK